MLKSSVFEFRQVSIDAFFRDSLAAIEFLDAAFNLGVDLVPIFREPTILLLLRIQISGAIPPLCWTNRSLGAVSGCGLGEPHRGFRCSLLGPPRWEHVLVSS
jgi:hypothetical protein